ncbi:MAG: MBL fold metallo-hydrolase [Acidilobaceae archaeon]
MLIRWCGHSYFILETSGIKIALDPHDGGSLGIDTCREESDLVLVTHNHYDHNAIEIASGADSIVTKWRDGVMNVKGLNIKGIRLYHDKARGALRGETIAYMIKVEDMIITHLGDLGHTLEEREVEELSQTDIILIPIGGVYTINYQEAWDIIKTIKPKIAIPMHYWIPGSIAPLDPIDKFLNIIKTQKIRLEDNKLEVHKETLPQKTTIIILPFPH